MAYSSQPGTGTVYCTANLDNNRLPRYAQVLGFYRTPKEYSDAAHLNDIGAFLQYDGILPPAGTLNERDSCCSMFIKGFLLSAPCVSQYHTTYAVAQMFAHDESNQNGKANFANIVGNGLLVVPKNASYTAYDAIEYDQGQYSDAYYYFKDIECNVYQLVGVNGNTNDSNIATIDGGGSLFNEGYKKLGSSTWHQVLYQNITVKILMLEIYDAYSYSSAEYFNTTSVSRALLEITVNGNTEVIEIVNDDNAIGTVNDLFVHEVTCAEGNPSSHGDCTHVAYNDATTHNERTVDNTNTDGQYIPDKAAKAIHESDLKEGGVVLSVFDFANFIITTESNCNGNDVVRTHLVKEFNEYSTTVQIDAEATDLDKMPLHISDSVPYLVSSPDELENLRDVIFDQAIVTYEKFYLGKDISNYTYKLFTKRRTSERYGFRRGTFRYNGNNADVQELTEQQIDSMENLTEIPYASMTSDGLFITPMEYYAGLTTNKVEGSKLVLENKVDANRENEPTYFWVETLKNWCTYEFEQLTDWNGFARLKVWNGINNWYYLDEILQQQRACQLTMHQMSKIRAAYKAGTDVYKNKHLLEKFRNILVANTSIYRFPYEKLNTTVLQRVYTPTHEPNWVVEDDTFFLIRVVSKAIDFICDYGMMIMDWTPVGLVYNGYKDGIGSAFGAGWNRWKSSLEDIFGGVEALVSPVINWLFADDETTDTMEKRLKRIDTRKVLVNAIEYLFLPYDTGYTSNDSTTFQTIRFRNEWFTDGVVSRDSLKPGHNVCNPIGSPLVVRSTTGELTLAVSMSYQGPWRQYWGDDDYVKRFGIRQEDVDMTNEMLANMLGDGKDKTAHDYLNIRGGLLNGVALGSSTSLQTVLANGVVQQNNAVNKSHGTVTLVANRSKTTSNVNTTEINTLTKW